MKGKAEMKQLNMLTSKEGCKENCTEEGINYIVVKKRINVIIRRREVRHGRKQVSKAAREKEERKQKGKEAGSKQGRNIAKKQRSKGAK